ncbi:amino acid ABC transporter permease [Deinococcus yavapaiensis]|uniref:Amino acid ABC transporter membrane protein (PAAT family) n=1 Tax=Deinococcus yavapaiensis KR-236 TaxID=694435 RepID=A0A318RZB9_9DEIO|nr:amino acid ABC transporter permease [Deinococcus yavapaiensis]PYE49387.1 amino acid ABC transporter membrane protein (PAAT family) [Deinococcus yavapaiensis KR-236]
MQVVLENLPFLLRASLVTLGYALGAMLPGFLLGLATALARLSRVPPLEWIARTYVSLIRGTPLLVQIYVVYYVLPDLGIDLGPLWSGVLALALNVGAYASEALRGAFLAVPSGQREAARALGLSTWHTFRDIEAPQALRIAVPALGNSFISLVKDTSLVSVITVVELLQEANLIIARTFQPTPLYLAVAVIYWIISSVLSLGLRRVEDRLSRHQTTGR